MYIVENRMNLLYFLIYQILYFIVYSLIYSASNLPIVLFQVSFVLEI